LACQRNELPMVVYTGFGSDSSSPESIVGSGEITRKVVADVLEYQLARHAIGEKTALDFIEHTDFEAPTRLFPL
jgi:hypothetical protein